MPSNKNCLDFDWEKDIQSAFEPPSYTVQPRPVNPTDPKDDRYWPVGGDSFRLVQADPDDILHLSDQVLGERHYHVNKMIWMNTVDRYLFQYMLLAQRQNGYKEILLELPDVLQRKYNNYFDTSESRKKPIPPFIQLQKPDNKDSENGSAIRCVVPIFAQSAYQNLICRWLWSQSNSVDQQSSMYYDGIIMRLEGDGKNSVIDFVPKFSLMDYIQHEMLTGIPRGLCCITGEDTGGSQSSLLRCIIDVNNDTFNGKVLAPYQSDPSLWTTHFHYFVQYIAQNFSILVEDIRKWFPILREKVKAHLSAGRLVDGAIYLALTGKILAEYGAKIGVLSAEECEMTYGSWSNSIIQTLKRSEDSSSELDPVKFYLSALFEAVDSDSERIARDKESFCLDTTILGYEHNGNWHVWPDRAYALAIKKSQLQRKSFPLGMVKIHAALADAHIIKVSTDNRHGKSQANYLHRESFGERPRMLVIYKEAALNYLES